MTAHDVVFLLVALLTGGAAVMTVTSKNLVHAALFLATTLGGIGGVFLVLGADFLALTQLIVYVGAVAVLFLFGLMLTRAPIGREALDSQHRGLGIAVAGGLFIVIGGLVIDAVLSGSLGGPAAREVGGPAIADLGIAIFATWVLPFELLSMLLLAALIGAILLARRDTGESGEEAEATHIALGEEPGADTDVAGGDATSASSREVDA